MGEMADYRLNGDDCEGCGMPFSDRGRGFPRRCDRCQPHPTAKNRAKKLRKKIREQLAAATEVVR